MRWIRKLLIQLLSAVAGLWLAARLIPEVDITAGRELQILIFSGLTLGLANYFVKPILKKITWPLRLLTLGLFGFVINMAIIWGVDILFPELIIKGLMPLFWTAVIVWGLGLLLPILVPKRKKIVVPKNSA